MTQHRDFNPLDVFPAGFLDALQETLGAAHLSPNFAVVKTSSTQLSVLASTGDAQVSASIGGSWRFVTSNVVASAPAGGAGTYNIWLTTRVLDTSQEDAGSFNYAFALKLGTAPTGSGAEALSRIVGTYTWDGAQITGVKMASPPDGSIAKDKLGVDALQAFLQLGVAATRKIRFGSVAPGTWGGSNTIDTLVPHGLGLTPQVAIGIMNSIATFSSGGLEVPVVVSIFGLDATNITFRLRTSDGAATNNAKPLWWLGIA